MTVWCSVNSERRISGTFSKGTYAMGRASSFMQIRKLDFTNKDYFWYNIIMNKILRKSARHLND